MINVELGRASNAPFSLNGAEERALAGFFINLFALLFSWISWGHLAGWASAWNTIYIRKDKVSGKKLVAHELCHIHQMNTHGKFKFMMLYAIEQCKVGYRNNKYEIEARAATIEQFRGIYTVEYGAYRYL